MVLTSTAMSMVWNNNNNDNKKLESGKQIYIQLQSVGVFLFVCCLYI